MIDKVKGVLAGYNCGYCGTDFQQKAKMSNCANKEQKPISNMVKCPNCGNFLKTWDDIKEIMRTLEKNE